MQYVIGIIQDNRNSILSGTFETLLETYMYI